MKNAFKAMVAMVMLTLATAAWGASEVVEGVTWYYQTSSSGGSTYAYITSGADKYTGDLTVPTTLGGYAVKAIGSSAFRDCTALKSVVIQKGVTYIDWYAFYNCSSLTSVTIPEGVTSIGRYAFYYCSSLTSVTIPEGVTSIGVYAFRGCSSLTSVTIPEGVTSIGSYAFYYCSSLTSVTIPKGVTSIGYEAFCLCSSLMSVTIPEGVTSIGVYAFRGCSSLTSVTIPEGVTSIGEEAFYNCSSLTRFDVPASVTSLGSRVIGGCSSLKTLTVASGNKNYKIVNNCIVSASGSTLIAVPFGCEKVIIPSGVAAIPGSMFSGDSLLTSVTIPEGVTSIGDYAFSGCSSLTSVTIPEGVTSIGYQAFYNCSSLMSVTFLGAPPSGVVNSCLLYYGKASYPREYGAEWQKYIGISSFHGYLQSNKPVITIVSADIRKNDATIMDVVYKVTSTKPKVKLRALAFQDGERSFAKVVRPETFVADTNGVATAANVGDEVVPNVEHTLSWKVPSDWSNQLAKVKFEVLTCDEDLLPLEVRTIPASDKYGKMDVTWNAITESQWFDALLWLYADKTDGLTLANGVLKGGASQLANGASVSSAAFSYVLGKMGYNVLSGAVLNYVNEETRLGLSPSGARQYGFKLVVGD